MHEYYIENRKEEVIFIFTCKEDTVLKAKHLMPK